MKYLLLGLIVTAVAGCIELSDGGLHVGKAQVEASQIANQRPLIQTQESTSQEEPSAELEKPTLYMLTSAQETRRPEKGDVYENNSRRIKIFQSCVEVDEKTKEETPFVLATGEDLVIAVVSKREYVDDEYLLPGKYLYCGPFQYQTAPVVQGVQKTGTKTVRMFMEVTDEQAQKIKEQRKAEKADEEQ